MSFSKVVNKCIKLYNGNASKINLNGDRDIEWSWIASQMPFGSGNALDFGNGGSFLGLIAAQKGYNVTSIDLGEITWPYLHPNLKFIRGDLLKMQFQSQFFDLIVNCSTIEHVGLVGRYDIINNIPDGDIEAMNKLHQIMKPSATMLLTIPVGQDTIIEPYHRVYGIKRLPMILEKFHVEKEAYWIKNDKNIWMQTNKENAINYEIPAYKSKGDPLIYALGCYVLKK